MNLNDQPLKGKIALVTGASRGGGKGIALVLGEAGATVYITGRSSGTSTRTDLPQTTLEATAAEITARGGKGIPLVCDSANDADMAAVIAHIERDHNRLDILVNNAWAGYEGYDNTFNSPFWEQPLERWDKMLRVGLRSHLAMTHHAIRLMLPRRAGLIINTTTYIDPLNWASERFLQSVPYDTVKMAINRLSWGMANNLREYNIPVLALAPGWMRTESMDLTEEQKLKTESVEYTGRAVVALATDPQLMRKTGKLVQTADLAREYDFRDIDGRQVAPFYELFPEFVM